MNKSSLGTIVAVVVIAALVAGTWFIAISPRLAEISTANEDRERVETLNAGHEATLLRLQTLAENIDEMKSDLAELSVAVPGELAFPAYLRELQAIGDATGTVLTVAGEPSIARYAAPADMASVDPEVAAAMGSVSTDNFVVVDMNISISGEGARVLDALTHLQQTRRFALVHEFTFPGNPADPAAAIDATIQLQLFTLLAQSVPVSGETSGTSVGGGQTTDDSGAVTQ